MTIFDIPKNAIRTASYSNKSNKKYFVAKAAANVKIWNGELEKTHFVTGSAGGDDVGNVELRAFVELIERITSIEAGANVQSTYSSFNKLKGQLYGPIIDPNIFVQHKPLVDGNILRKCNISWCEAISLTNNNVVMLPCQLLFNKWDTYNREMIFSSPDSCGSAAHFDIQTAIKNALLEIIERDLLILSWRIKDYPVTKLSRWYVKDSHEQICFDHKLIYSNYLIYHANLPYVVLSIIRDKDDKAFVTGYGCAENITDATTKAMDEAFMVWFDMRSKKITSEFIHYPRNSADHIKRGYTYFGKSVLEFYECKPKNQIIGNFYKFDIKLISEVYNSDIYAVLLPGAFASRFQLKVIKLVLPEACKKEVDSFWPNFYSSRFELFRKTYGDVNIQPHIFG